MSEYRLVLRSFDSLQYHKDNKTYDFRVKLDKPLCLDGSWTIALTELTVSKLKTT